MYSTYRDAGLQILAYPCNQFGGQEPDSEETVKEFISSLSPAVTFPVMGKIEVKGDGADPIYQYLVGETNAEIQWNFAKFLVDADGKPVKFYAHRVNPTEMISDIEELLNKQWSITQ